MQEAHERGISYWLGAYHRICRVFSKRSGLIWHKKDVDDNDDDDSHQWPSISPNPQFEQFIALSYFKDFRRFLPRIFADESKKESDPWVN
jgi:hypothetical protein